MTLRGISDTSIAISLFRYFCRWYRSLEQRISYMYHNSQAHSLVGGFWQKIKICFRCSFLGRVTETKHASPVVLDNSQAVQYMGIFYKRCKDKIIYHLSSSSMVTLGKDIKKGLYFSPVETIGTILVTIIFVNAVFSVILQKQIGFWSFAIQALLLLLGTAGLSCEASWSSIKESSAFLRKMQAN